MSDALALPARIALVGNPNCGKTALFNALTGSRQKVGNYPGVTVERKEGAFATPGGRRIRVLDLPGTYSLRAHSPDETVTRDVVLGRLAGETAPDLLVCVADATNLRLVLRLLLELKQAGRPLLLVLNMFDIARHRGIAIDARMLSRELGVPVVTAVAVRRGGTADLMEAIDRMADAARPADDGADWHTPTRSEISAAHREVERILAACVAPPLRPDVWTARIDRVLLHPVSGIATLLLILFLIFQAVFAWAGPATDMIRGGFDALAALIALHLPDGLLRSLLSDGLISGIGSVLVFLPQIMILFFFLILLEDLGYMPRAAFLMDRIMGYAGLHGRAFIPLLSSFACAIPGIMATRVIDGRRDRLATILIAPLMTCSARIPVYTLLISAFVPRQQVAGLVNLQGLVMFGLYAAGIVSAFIVAFVLRRLLWRGATDAFIMELPAYKLPDPRNVLLGVLQRARLFLRRAGTIIFSMMLLIWFLSSVPGAPDGATAPAIHYSFAGMIGQALQPLLAPIGFTWEIAVVLVAGLAAREVAVAGLGTLYAVAGGAETTGALADALAAHWSLGTALALLVWYVYAPQCLSTLAIIRRETNSWRWPAAQFVYMFALAYAAAFVTYRLFGG
ncbi:MAG: ferrous iron transport protein B [Rhodospirillales bacterium]|nr:MAG: ferrous iron transport protein B [Rhodospirillales bacterium]